MAARYTRRSALHHGAIGLLSAVAGCIAGSNDDQPRDPATTGTTTTGTSSPPTATRRTLAMGTTATSADGVSVTISAPRVRKLIFTPDVGSPTHAYPAGSAESQFLGVSVSTQTTDITSLQLDPVIDGRRLERASVRHTHSPGSAGRLSFRVPIGAARRAAIEWRPSPEERYRWPLPDTVVAAIGNAPQFAVEQFAVPEEIPSGDPFTARLTVRNTGARDGRFLAVVLTEGAGSVPLVDEFTIPVPVGESVTRTLSGREISTGSRMTAILDWGINEHQASFSITE